METNGKILDELLRLQRILSLIEYHTEQLKQTVNAELEKIAEEKWYRKRGK